MYSSRKHSLAPESVTSASSAGGGYSQKRRRVVQNTPVPEKYLYRHSTSRLSASRASSVLGEDHAPDGSPLRDKEWARASTLSDGSQIITDGDKGKRVDEVGVGAVEVKRSTLIPESPFARIISRQKHSRGISTTTSLAYPSPNGSLQTSYKPRCDFPQNTTTPPLSLSTTSVRHTGRDSNKSNPSARPTPSGSQHIYSSFQRSTFEFSSPFKPKSSVTLNTPEEVKAKSDSLLSFFGNALSRAKSALSENRELQDAERKRKLKEDARRRAIEEERRKRDEVFAEIAREEDELARLAIRKDKDMETQFPSIASRTNCQPPTSTTVSQAVSSSTATVAYEPNSHTKQRFGDHSTLAQPCSSDVLTLTDQALVDCIQSGNHPFNVSNRRNIVLNAPVQELPKVANPKRASPEPTAPIARPAKPQVEVICLDSDSDGEEEQYQQREPQSEQSTIFDNVDNEEEEEEEEEEVEEGYGEVVSNDDCYEDEDGEEGYDEQEYEEEEGGYEDDVEEEEEELDEEGEEEVEVIYLDGEEDDREGGEEIGIEAGQEEKVEEEEIYEDEVEGEVEEEEEEEEEEGDEEGGEGGGGEAKEEYEEHQVNSDGGANLVEEEVQEVPDLRQRFGASQAPVFPPGEEEVPTEKDEESFRDDHDDDEEEGEQEAEGGEVPDPTVPQVILNHGNDVPDPVSTMIITSQPTSSREGFQDCENDKLVNLEESENTQLFQGESLGAVPVYPGQDRERTPIPALKSSCNPDEVESTTEADRFSEFHSRSDVREMHEDEDEDLSPDDLIQDRTTRFEDEVARGGNEEYVEEGEQEGLDFMKVRADEDASMQGESETTAEAGPVMETRFFHFHNAGRPQNFEKHDEEKKSLAADIPSITEDEGDAMAIDPQLEYQAMEINTSGPNDAENLEVEEESQIEEVKFETKVPPTAEPYFIQVIEDSDDEGVHPQPADSVFEAPSRATTYEGGEEEVEGVEVNVKWERGKEQEEDHEDEQKGMKGHSSPSNSDDEQEARGETREAESIHIAPLCSTERQIQEEFSAKGRALGEFVPEGVVPGEETPTTLVRAKRQKLPATLDVKQVEAKHKNSSMLDQPSPIKLGEQIHADEAIMSDTRSVISRASRASSVVSILEPQPQKRKRGPSKRKAMSSRDQTYNPMKDTGGRYIEEEVEVEDAGVSPKKKKQRRATGQRKAIGSSPAKMGPFRGDEAVEAEQRKEVILTSEAMAAHTLGQRHNHEAEGMELRDGKVISHATPVASRRPSPVAERLQIVEGQIEGSAAATGVVTGKELRDGKVLAPLTISAIPSKKKTPPLTPTMTTTPKSATSPHLVRDRPLLFGAAPAPLGSPPRPRTPSPKRRARAGSNASSVLSTPEVKSLRNRDVIVGTPIVEEEEQRNARASSVEYEKKHLRGRKQSSVETSPRRLRGRK